LQELKKYLEKIAKNRFTATKDAAEAALCYILAGKKNVLALLYKG
jgi:hypothetical protein